MNPASSTYTADRYKVSFNADSGTMPTTITHSQQSLNAGDILNSFNFYRINLDSVGSNLGNNSWYTLNQFIEKATRFLAGLNK